ncbi:hypothetical protein ACQWG3_25175 [Salmonella enterica subsp. enterica serovar Infantis]
MRFSKLWVSWLYLLSSVSLPLQAASAVTVVSLMESDGEVLGNLILLVME